MSARIPKACQLCRSKKIKCNGETPCSYCVKKSAPACTYRQTTRIRRLRDPVTRADGIAEASTVSPSQTATALEGEGEGAGAGRSDGGQRLPDNEQLNQSVSATQSNAISGPVQLFYGASSQFAFLQQIHRRVLSEEVVAASSPSTAQDASSGLEMFLQRSFFFGFDPLVNMTAGGSSVHAELSLELAMSFVDNYMAISHPLLPFLEEVELRNLTRALCGVDSRGLQSRSEAIILAILAVGALSTDDLAIADSLFSRAKVEALAFDEAVNLRAVQLSMILGFYQTSIGRPNSAYLHLGTACRKAFAMGLHVDIFPSGGVDSLIDKTQEQRRVTMWCLYFHECWHSLSLGRKCALESTDISCELPSSSPLICRLAQLAKIMAKSAEIIYRNQTRPSWEFFKTAQNIHTELQTFAEKHSIAIAFRGDGDVNSSIDSVFLHNLYYHTILLTFRPFLIARAARLRQITDHSDHQNHPTGVRFNIDEMWLRQACRYAVDAAQDQISFHCSRVETVEACKSLRYNCFFIESSCAVLLYDALCHKYKFSHNMEYVNAGLDWMSKLVTGGPVTCAIESTRQLVSVVEQEVMSRSRTGSRPFSQVGNENSHAQIHTDRRAAGIDNANMGLSSFTDHRSVEFPPLSTSSSTVDPLIHMRDRVEAPGHDLASMDYDLDIYTTDLYHFFPDDSRAGLNQQ